MKKSQELVESEGYTEQNNKESVRQWALLHAFDYLNRCCHLHCLNWVKMMDRVNDCTGFAKLLSCDYSQWFLPRSV